MPDWNLIHKLQIQLYSKLISIQLHSKLIISIQLYSKLIISIQLLDSSLTISMHQQ